MPLSPLQEVEAGIETAFERRLAHRKYPQSKDQEKGAAIPIKACCQRIRTESGKSPKEIKVSSSDNIFHYDQNDHNEMVIYCIDLLALLLQPKTSRRTQDLIIEDRPLDIAIILFWSGAILIIFSLSSLIIKIHGHRIVKAFCRKEKILYY
jgi:hypothetical protein